MRNSRMSWLFIVVVLCFVYPAVPKEEYALPVQYSKPTPLIDGAPPPEKGPDHVEIGGFEVETNLTDLFGNGTLYGPGAVNGSELTDGPPPRISFSRARLDRRYGSEDNFTALGMEHLYLLTEIFLGMVHREKEIPPELEALVERELVNPSLDLKQASRVVKDLESNWDALVFHYIGLSLLMVLGILLATVTPVVGLVFGCCRCAGKCGGDFPSYDKKRDPCKRIALGTILVLLIVAILLGLVCSFVTNARVESGLTELPSRLRVSVADTKLYLNNTHKEVKTLCEDNFKELQKTLFNKLDRSGELINSELARVSKAIAINNLTSIASSLELIKKDLHIIRNTTIQLQEETSYLQSGLRDVAGRLKKLKNSCEEIPECRGVIAQYGSRLEINNDFNKLPSVKDKLQEVTRLIENDIEIEVKRGKRAFDSIAREIQSKVQISIPEIKQQIRNAGHELKKIPRDLGRKLRQIDYSKANEVIDVSEKYIGEYAYYRYWGFFLVCCLLLLITLCFTMGLMFGCCGRRPDEASSCYKTTGASWLMWGVGLTFLFSIVIMLATTGLFVVGSLSEVLVCDPLRDPVDSEVFAVASRQINLEKVFQDRSPDITEVIRKCHLNQSIYAVLDLHSYDSLIENLSNYRDFMKLEEKIDRIKIEIGESIDTNVQILSKEARQQLKMLAKSSLAHKESWDYYTDILDQEVIKVDLLNLAAVLNQTAEQLPPDYGTVAVKLKNEALFLEGLRRWLSSIKRSSRTLREATQRLGEELKFNKTSLRVAIMDLMKEAEFARRYLQLNGSIEVVDLVSRFTDDFLTDVDFYVDHLRQMAVSEVGRCGPMSEVYNATSTAVCKTILNPFNGFWASVGWCFLLFLPSVAIAVKLASLYRKTEPYSGPLTDSRETMYDAFSEREILPLASCDKKSTSRGRERAAYPPQQFSAPPHPQDFASNSEWGGDYPPGGGPPRYTSQPTLSPEYERPPPYYYPGPGNS